MSRIFITGSADGLGLMAARLLIEEGHNVVLHARNEQRASDAMAAAPGAESVLIGDLSTIGANIKLAKDVNESGPFDAVIHNAAIGYRESRKIVTPDGLSDLFAINSLSPYILTCLINKPSRLIYTSSALHQQGDPGLKDLNWNDRAWNGLQAYSDSKFHNLIVALAVARKWKNVLSNAVEPGWVATKMGGPGASDSLKEGPKTQAWLALGEDPDTLVTGEYFYHQKTKRFNNAAADAELQDTFLSEYGRLSGITFPE